MSLYTALDRERTWLRKKAKSKRSKQIKAKPAKAVITPRPRYAD